MEQARPHSWLKIIATVRDEYLAVRQFSLRGHEENPLYRINDLLYPAPEGYSFDERGRIWHIPPLSPSEQRALYEGLQREKAKNKALPASTTPWDKLPASTKALLQNPLLLLIFMRTYDGKEAGVLHSEWDLFREYVRSLEGRYEAKTWENLDMILSKMLKVGSAELSDEDVGEISLRWSRMEIAPERRDKWEPVEVAILVGVMVKKAGSEGGTYVIPFQALCEALLFEKFRKEDREFSEESLKKWMSHKKFPELQGALSHVAEEIIKKREAGKLALFIKKGFSDSLTPAFSRASARIKEEEGEEFEKFILEVLRKGRDPEVGIYSVFFANSLLWKRGIERNRVFLLFPLKDYLEKEVKRNSMEEGTRNFMLAATYGNLGDTYKALGKIEEALRYYKKNLEIMEKLVKQNPTERNRKVLAISYSNLGDTYTSLGKAEKALKYYRKSKEIMKGLAKQNPTEENRKILAIFHKKLGDTYKALGKIKEALQYYDKDLKIREELVKQNSTEENRRELATSYIKLGDIYGALGKPGSLYITLDTVKESVEYYEKALEILEEIAKQNPTDKNKRTLAVTYSWFGDLYASVDKSDKAFEYYRKALKIIEEIAEQYPTEENKRNLAISYERLGDTYGSFKVRKFEEAIELYEKALEVMEEIAKQNPTNKNKRELAMTCKKMGKFLIFALSYRRDMGITFSKEYIEETVSKAISDLEKAKELYEEIYPAYKDNASVAFEFAEILFDFYRLTKKEHFLRRAKEIICPWIRQEHIPSEYRYSVFLWASFPTHECYKEDN